MFRGEGRALAILVFTGLLAVSWVWFAPWRPSIFYGDDLPNLLQSFTLLLLMLAWAYGRVFERRGQWGPNTPISAEQSYKLLNTGNALLGYESLESAQYYLHLSHSLIPDNPYPAYFLGVSYEKQGILSEAQR